MADEENPKYLYAIAYERRFFTKKGVVIRPNIEYVHAENETHAKLIFQCMEPDRRRVKLVSAGLAIGNFCDEHGENKTADVEQRLVIA